MMGTLGLGLMVYTNNRRGNIHIAPTAIHGFKIGTVNDIKLRPIAILRDDIWLVVIS